MRALNTKVETFPANLVAGMFSIRRAEYFETAEPEAREVPAVRF